MVGRAITGPTDYPQIPELAERGFARATEFFEMLNERLGESEYVAGNRFTLADITALVVVDFASWVKSGPTDAHTHTKRWHDLVSKRPSAAL
jgi:glutathione S-transferase